MVQYGTTNDGGDGKEYELSGYHFCRVETLESLVEILDLQDSSDHQRQYQDIRDRVTTEACQ